MRGKKKFIVIYGSERVPNKVARRKARLVLRKGGDPLPKYRTGKFWND